MEGSGTRFVGDNINPFYSGDLVIIGSNTPHAWVSNPDSSSKREMVKAICIQFNAEHSASHFQQFPELVKIRDFLI